jgi:transcriptional regulator with XRE-family HTH domain
MMDLSITTRTDSEVMVEIGHRLRALRKATGLSQTEAAGRAALDRSTVSRAENGDNPTLRTLIRLLRVFGRLDALETFIPVPEVSPMALVRQGRAGRAPRPSTETPAADRDHG